jgi:hypothetical protein
MSQDKFFTREQVSKDPGNDYVLAKWDGDTPLYRMVMSEEQCHRAAMEDWVVIIAQLWDAIGKPVDEKRLNMYCKQLQIVPLGLLDKGVSYAIRNNTFSNIPPIGTIWEGVRKELVPLNIPPGTDIADAIEIWNERIAKRAIYSL